MNTTNLVAGILGIAGAASGVFVIVHLVARFQLDIADRYKNEYDSLVLENKDLKKQLAELEK